MLFIVFHQRLSFQDFIFNSLFSSIRDILMISIIHETDYLQNYFSLFIMHNVLILVYIRAFTFENILNKTNSNL